MPDLTKKAKTPKTKISFVCDPEVKAALEKLADEERRSLSSLIEIIVADHLAKKAK